MHAEDRVLVAVMNRPLDLEIAREQGWYRVPESRASRGAFFEYVAFYLTGAFGELRWTVPYYARNLGHELVTRRELLPEEPDHPRAGEHYLRFQLGPLQSREPPIVSLRWRRITFIHTTWDRFQAASEINDLFAEGDEFVDRLYHALRDSGLHPERQYPLRESSEDYAFSSETVPVLRLAVPCRQGALALRLAGSEDAVVDAQGGYVAGLCLEREQVLSDLEGCLRAIRLEVERRGGLLPLTMDQRL